MIDENSVCKNRLKSVQDYSKMLSMADESTKIDLPKTKEKPTPLEDRLGHDLSQIQVIGTGLDIVADKTKVTLCPLMSASPGFCTFGGACHQCPTRIQTKPAISQPGEQYEREANRIAEQTVRVSEPRSQEDGALSESEFPLHGLGGGGEPFPNSVYSFSGPHFGHYLNRAKVQNNLQGAIQTKAVVDHWRDRLGAPSTVFRNLDITASPEAPKEKSPTTPSISKSGQPHPFTAILLMSMITLKSCVVPKGQYGAAKVAKYRIFDATGKPVSEKMTVTEKFSKIEGPDEIFGKLKPKSYEATDGSFDDCYRLYSPKELPDFRLKVEQNHMIGDEIISKNHITYTPSDIWICSFPRKEKDFGAKCKLY